MLNILRIKLQSYSDLKYAAISQSHHASKSRRIRRGTTLLDAALALVILTVVVSQIVDLASQYARRSAALMDARYLTDLATAGRSLVVGQVQGFATGTATTLTPAQLATAGVFANERTSQSATGRVFSVSVLRRSANEVVIMARASIRAGETVTYDWPATGEGVGLVGLVHLQSPEFIRGPALNYGLAWMMGGFVSAKPQLGELVVLDVIREDQSIAPYLHRFASALNPAHNMMQTDLNLNGNSIVNAGDISANALTVTNEITTTGVVGTTNFTGNVVAGALTVSGTSTLQNNLAVAGGITANTAQIASGTVSNSMTTKTATVSGVLSVQDATVNGALTASTLAATSVVATSVNAIDVVAVHVAADLITAEDISSIKRGEFETLTTGSCTGC